ncbi:MAG: 2-hydroxyacid dehydrogenase [Pseudochelatococcus sp.]|jgi:glyoxylate/hydroxypyruvate reductase A|uniref:2-hydroxyacid dehydrogenase n=1 Tax=Pseudochelatococcus sp. TaxID=2020869 RepID=UPI003D94607C
MSVLLAISGMPLDMWQREFETLLPDMNVYTPGEPFDRRAIHYAVAWRHPPRSLNGLPNLAAIFSPGAGVDHLLRDPDLPHVPIYRVVDADLTGRMSEYVVLHCLLHLRGLLRDMQNQRQRHWAPDPLQPAAGNVRVGIMGMGVLGRDAAEKLLHIGFDVAGWSRTPKDVPGIAMFAGEAQLPAFLARTDILVSLLPLTEETRGVLNKSVFSGLARNGRIGRPVIINAGRGGLQNEADILEALGDGTLGAASLDVFETEPLPVDSPLWDHPSVIITPHSAAMSDHEAISRRVASQIRAVQAGETPEGLVNVTEGY